MVFVVIKCYCEEECQRPHEKRLNALGYVTVPKYWKNVKFKFALRFHQSAVKYGTIAWFEQQNESFWTH